MENADYKESFIELLTQIYSSIVGCKNCQKFKWLWGSVWARPNRTIGCKVYLL